MAFKMPQPALYSDSGLVPSLWRILRILEFMAILAFFGFLVSLGETWVHGLLWPNYGFLRFSGLLAFLKYLGSYGLRAVRRGPWAVGVIGGPQGPNLLGTQGDQGVQKWPLPNFHPTWPGPIDGVQDHQDPGLPKVAGEALGDEFSPKGV